jgi:hypothetical protein
VPGFRCGGALDRDRDDSIAGLFAEHSGEKAASQIKAFEDTWNWDQESARTYFETVQAGVR